MCTYVCWCMSVSIYVPLCDSNRPDSFIFTIIILNSIHCKWVKSAWTLNQWLILHSHEYSTNFCTISSECSESVLYIYYITVNVSVCPLEMYGRETEWIPEAPVSLSSLFAIDFGFRILSTILKTFIVGCTRDNVFITVIKNIVISVLESIFCSLVRWDVRRDSQQSRGSSLVPFCGRFFIIIIYFFNSLSSALRVIKINSDSRAGHSLEWKRQITRGEEKESLCSQVRMRQTPPGSEWPHSVVTVDCSNHMTHQ